MSDQPDQQTPVSKAIPLKYHEDETESPVGSVEATPTADTEAKTANGGHTFVVTTVVTETVTETREVTHPTTATTCKAIAENKTEAEEQKTTTIQTPSAEHEEKVKMETKKEEKKEEEKKEEEKKEEKMIEKNVEKEETEKMEKEQVDDERPGCSSSSTPSSPTKAVVPISTSLPSKLLRLHAKRSAQALLHQVEQSQSLDSQFGSEEGGAVGGDVAVGSGNNSSSSEFAGNDCAEIFDDEGISPSSSAPAMSPPPPRSSPVDCDVGMGSSIDDSEESEVDDELKPLAVDNHVVPVHADAPELAAAAGAGVASPEAAVLSEANLEKFRRHHHPHHALENIYLHPNFKYDFEPQSPTGAAKEMSPPDMSPPPAVAPANSPTEQRRVHRSFLTMGAAAKRPSQAEIEVADSVTSAATSTEPPNAVQEPLVNEIDTLDPALVPSDELAAEIAEAVEFYFSNESILKDAFLLKHVRRNKEGFVSLKLVSSFKRVRQLTKEWKVVGNAVRRKSRHIELNDVGTKVRRVEPLPSFDETMPSRTIVACDLPLDKLTIERVSDIFSRCGEIALIRILKPGMAIPVDVRQFMNKYPEMQQKECALVEYLESSAAREAKHLEGDFQVYDMVAPKKKTGKKAAVIQVAAPVARMVENYGRYYNDASYERTRGGSFSGAGADPDFRYKLRRNNSDFHTKADGHNYYQHAAHGYNNNNNNNHHHYQPSAFHPHLHRGSLGSVGGGSSEHVPGSYHNHHPHQHQHQHHFQPRGSIGQDSIGSPSSPGGGSMNFFALSPRRYSNSSTVAAAAASPASGESHGSAAPEGHHHHHHHHSNSSSNNNNSNINANSGNNTANNNNNNNNTTSSSLARRLSNCSDTYSTYSEMSRRPSNCSETATAAPPQRRDSNCSDSCPCARRVSDFAQPEVYRKTSQGSIGSGERRFSNGSIQFERSFSNASDHVCGSGNGNGCGSGNVSGSGNNVGVSSGVGGGVGRRLSNDFHLGERKQSLETQTGLPTYDHDGNVGGGGGGYNVFRRYSNNFHNNVANKLAQYDNAQYINGRRISTDSGYDRRYSFGSEYEGSPRSRTGSFLNNYKHGGGGNAGGEFDGSPRSRTGSFLDGSPRSRSGSFAQRNAENLVRTPIGPDGSKGFGSRARKFGQTVSPVN